MAVHLLHSGGLSTNRDYDVSFMLLLDRNGQIVVCSSLKEKKIYKVVVQNIVSSRRVKE